MDEKAAMIKELSDGIDLAKELRTRMLISSSDHDDHHQQPLFIHSLLDQMLSSFNKSISLASLLNSPPPPLVSRKRKKMADGIELVKVSPDDGLVSGLEGPLNDGFSWRKYGQKDILKAKYPRGYYRCSHRHSQGCAATKHVQRLDEDPSIYQVIYKGEHTCTTAAQYTKAHKKPNTTIYQQDVSSGLGPNVEPMGRENEAQSFNPFSLTEAQIEPGLFDDCNLSSSPGFWSPPTLESDYLPAFPCSIAGYGLGLNMHTSESDVSESMSGLSSATNSPNVGHFEFTFDDESLPDIDVNFSFDCESLICKI